MKRVILLFVLLLSACSPLTQQAALPTATALPTTCDVWSVKSVLEHDGNYNTNGAGSFANIVASDGGATVWERIDGALLAKILSIYNANPSAYIFTYIKMYEGKNGKDTGNYFRIDGTTDPTISILWNWVGPPSPDQAYKPGIRNYVCVSKIVAGVAYLVTAPKMSNYDWSDGIDWLHWIVYGNWPGTPALFPTIPADPASFPIAIGKSNRYFAISSSWLFQYMRTDNIPWRANGTFTNTPSITPTTTPTLTPTPTFTPTVTITPTPGTNEPLLRVVVNDLGVDYLGAPKYLSIRPSPNVSNVPVGYFYKSTILYVIVVYADFYDTQGAHHIGWFGQDRNGYYVALKMDGVCFITPCNW